jgi:lipopolysaccharide transport system ATP-binding protein
VSTIIRVEALSKRYRLGQHQQYGTVRDSLADIASAPRRWLTRYASTIEASRGDRPEIWALDDVSFDIGQGEIVGIVGRNGSGKSTLLKILSRITEPTKGRVSVTGRVGSLLEVGTGFHPELTGRENVYVNGAILGMRRREIAAKFDEIVAFADLTAFIDTPVKHYSSGMHMRLAFAVAAHLEPEILVIDEVLAVGDLAFQRKCLGKMDDVSRHGRTVLLVSHQMNQLRRLCTRCVWLEEGRVVGVGPSADVIRRYEASYMDGTREMARGVTGTSFLSWTLGESSGLEHSLRTFGPITVRFRLVVHEPIRNGHHGLALRDQEGAVVWGTGLDNLTLEPGSYEIVYNLASLPLRPGAYRWLASIYDNGQHLDSLDCIPELSVETTPTGHRRDEWAGVLNLQHSIQFEPLRTSAAEPHPESIETGRASSRTLPIEA